MLNSVFEKTILEKIEQLFSGSVFDDFEPTEKQLSSIKFFFRCSDFCAQVCLKHPHIAREIFETCGNKVGPLRKDYQNQLQARVEGVSSFDTLGQIIRQFRYEAMLRIAWRDLVENIPVEQTLRELSWLADACIISSTDKLMTWAVEKYGQPVDEHNHPVHLVTLAMGKLGADELNFSSDIDLIFCYSSEGSIESQAKNLSHREFFIRLCQQLVKLLSENTAHGFVYRVDTRLRPFGESGQLVLGFDAMENYYERHGREWERYAMIKARPITQDPQAAKVLVEILTPFVYRRYLDFSTFASLREMKQLIEVDVSRKGANKHIKLGSGGIREIEFIGQAYQLLRGGRIPLLRQRGIITILSVLHDMGFMEKRDFTHLHDAYLFLRKTENTLQAYAEQQTHVLPDEPLQQQRLAYALGFDSWNNFFETISRHMSAVQTCFESMFTEPSTGFVNLESSNINAYAAIWSEGKENAETLSLMVTTGYSTPKKSLQKIFRLRNSSRYKTMGANGKQRFDKLMPLLIPAVGASENPDACLVRIIRLLEAIAKRTAYIALLAEHPAGLSQLITLFDKSVWVADLLSSHPILMDELIDTRRLYEPMYKGDLEQELSYIFNPKSENIERQVQRLIDFKQANFLRIAASELMNVMPVEKVSDHLTYVAEVVLTAVKQLATNLLSAQYGAPTHFFDGSTHTSGFCIIAYGKLGGLELGFGSDLDLVFLHDSCGEKQQTNGEKPINNAVFFVKLGQRIIHFLNTLTQGGRLYDVDMRLRPSGGAGMLVSSLSSFLSYQQNKAWTWEHQALVRARFVSGDESLRQAFTEIRQSILCSQRDVNILRREVCEMRIKMRRELLKNKTTSFDLKQGVGGITDIEFIIQFLVLRWAHTYPEIVQHTDNISLLDALLKNALIAEDDAKMLHNAYLTYRHAVHQYILQGKTQAISSDVYFHSYRDGVARIWNELLETY